MASRPSTGTWPYFPCWAGAATGLPDTLKEALDAGKSIVIPVSCVEQGRWGYRSRHFEDQGRILFGKAHGGPWRGNGAKRTVAGSGQERSRTSHATYSLLGRYENVLSDAG